MKIGYIEKGVSQDGKPTGMLLDEFGGVMMGGLIEQVRSFARECGYQTEEFDPKEGRPEFKKRPDSNEKPAGLSALGEKAYEAIMAVLKEHKATYTGGCKTFYSPAEWKERGEEYGIESELIVVYDGGDVRPFFSMDACYEIPSSNRYATYEKMQAALEKVGAYFEECTGWYAAVYPQ